MNKATKFDLFVKKFSKKEKIVEIDRIVSALCSYVVWLWCYTKVTKFSKSGGRYTWANVSN